MNNQPLLEIKLHLNSFEPLNSLRQWQDQQTKLGHKLAAAESVFIGRMRSTATDGKLLSCLELEHYPGMTEKQLMRLAEACCHHHGVESCLVEHRVGRILPNEAIVLVAINADRRGPAQRCCQELLELIKHEAPFWKREWLVDGSSHWLDKNTPQ